MLLSARMCSACTLQQSPLVKCTAYIQVRGSATVKLNGVWLPVKRRSNTQTYTELLEISNHVETKRTSVKRLSPTDLTMLAKQPDISLDQLHKLKERLAASVKAEKAAKVAASQINSPPQVKSSHFDNAMSETNKQRVMIPKAQSPLQTVQKPLQSKPHNVMQKRLLDKRYRQLPLDSFTQLAISYVDLCLFLNRVNLASTGLLLYRMRSELENSQSKHAILLYNKLIGHFASQGQLANAVSLYNTLKSAGIEPTSQTFAYMFEAAAKDTSAQVGQDVLKMLSSDLATYKKQLNDIFLESSFEKGRIDATLQGVHRLDNKFMPDYPFPLLTYDCTLLKDIDTAESRATAARQDLFTHEQLLKHMDEQLQIESQSFVEVESIAVHDDSVKSQKSEQKIQQLEELWRESARMAFRKKLKILQVKERDSSLKLLLRPYLECVNEEDYVNVMMNYISSTIHGNDGNYATPIHFLAQHMGEAIETIYQGRKAQLDGVLDSRVDTYKKYLDWYLTGNVPEGTDFKRDRVNHRIAWELIEHRKRQQNDLVTIDHFTWPPGIASNVGWFLLDIILNDLKITNDILGRKNKNNVSAFYKVVKFCTTSYIEQLKAHPAILDIYAAAPRRKLYFSVNELPSSCIPVPWTSVDRGVNFRISPEFVRVQDMLMDTAYLKKEAPETFYPTMDAVNELGAVPWVINAPILDIIIKVFRDGGSKKLDVPLSPSKIDCTPPKGIKTPSELYKFQRNLRKLKSETYSLWCDALYRLSIANHFRNKIFWLPHNIDFRGRTYTIAPHLSHLGADLGRSLLVFARKEPLGPNGLDWLKIHTINLTGLKKRSSLQERLDYANEIIDDIVDSAEKPLTGKMWWVNSDEPWQTLAACMELAAALKHPNPSAYLSNFPIHQDGSCNGLQHYAALGRDPIGARSVNLASSKLPQDVYSAVAALVEKQRAEDVEENGLPIAAALKSHVVRKVIKQTVMTTVYGVTKYGARLQINKQLVERELPDKMAWEGSMYLTEVTFKTLKSMFRNARDIQDWLVHLATIVCCNLKQCVVWRTPLGLIVQQPYVKNSKYTGKEYLNTAIVKMHSEQYNKKGLGQDFQKIQLRIDTAKQKNAFAPNFIHSLDSSHMMLTSLKCSKLGITFVAIHDCYWTHACNVDTMNRICREKFVDLHSQPILEDLIKGIREQSNKSTVKSKLLNQAARQELEKAFTNTPRKGKFNIEEVKNSRYFFS